ncbi:Vomeronasal type-1 receptor 4 [Lemmus lemmus]
MAIRIIFLSQTTTGILGNISTIFYYLALYHKECTLKPTDQILMNLMAVNALIMLSEGVPNTMAAFGLKQFLNDFECRLLKYIHRLSRSVSIGTICLLSVFQVLSIGPRKSYQKNHKDKFSKYIGRSIALLWALHMSISLIFFMDSNNKKNSKNVTRKWDLGYCSIVGRSEISDSLYVVLVMCSEVVFSVVIAWSSGSMIAILYRHKQRVQHIRSSHGSSRNSPESTAIQNILVLVSTFLAFYSLSSILRGCIALLENHSWWLMNTTCLISLCFPCLGPFFLISHYSIVSRLNLAWIKIKSLILC